MVFNPIIFDIITDLHGVSTYLNMRSNIYEYRKFLPIFRLIGVGGFETALYKLYILNNDLTLLTLPPYLMVWYHQAIEKLENVVNIN